MLNSTFTPNLTLDDGCHRKYHQKMANVSIRVMVMFASLAIKGLKSLYCLPQRWVGCGKDFNSNLTQILVFGILEKPRSVLCVPVPV